MAIIYDPVPLELANKIISLIQESDVDYPQADVALAIAQAMRRTLQFPLGLTAYATMDSDPSLRHSRPTAPTGSPAETKS